MWDGSDSKKIFYIVVSVMTLVILIVGVTISIYNMVFSNKKDSTELYTGKLEINFKDGVYIDNPRLWPMSEPSYNDYSSYIYRNNFSVISKSTLDQTITVSLNINTNEFSKESLKYSLYNSKGVKIGLGYVPQSGNINIIANTFLGRNDTCDYTLLIWLDNKNYNQNEEQGKMITGTLKVDAVQLKY